jgi:Tannase and feruloyl esterase
MHNTNGFRIPLSIVAGSLLAIACAPAAPAQTNDGGTLTEAACTGAALGGPIAPGRIGEPVSAVVLESRVWVESSGNTPDHCMVNGRLDPVDRSATARPIRFGVALPAAWNGRAIQMGGGGMNGSIPGLAGGFGGPSNLSNGFATYGSDSGHSNGDDEWALNDEAIRNLGYMQMKKTHDVAMILIERAYDERPAYNYYVGNSQGGREALTVAQRYPQDYDGVLSTVPIVGFSSLMLSRAHMRIQERQMVNWVPPVKGNAILAEFMRRCDDLDGRLDGVINDYFDCRAIFDVNDGIGEPDPWSARRCENDVDPDPEDASQDACLTSGQIETLEFFFSSYEPDAELANGRTSFGMWAPTTAVGNPGALAGAAAPAGGGRGAAAPAGPGRGAALPGGARGGRGRGGAFPGRGGGPAGGGGGGLLVGQRYRGQEGATDDAPLFTNLGSLGVIGFVMEDLDANPMDLDIAKVRDRREEVSRWLDSTDPDLRAFEDRGGKLIVIVGTDDTTASSGEQQSYYQSVIDFMGREAVDAFARLYVLPQTGHGLSGRSAAIDGTGESVEATQIPNSVDRFGLLQNWVENGISPGMSEVVTGGSASRPMCSYPDYPRYESGDPAEAESYRCTDPTSSK